MDNKASTYVLERLLEAMRHLANDNNTAGAAFEIGRAREYLIMHRKSNNPEPPPPPEPPPAPSGPQRADGLHLAAAARVLGVDGDDYLQHPEGATDRVHLTDVSEARLQLGEARVRVSEEEGRIALIVDDDGPGIPEEYKQLIPYVYGFGCRRDNPLEMDLTEPIALIQNGTLNLRDYVVAGATWGRVKAMQDDKGRKLRKAGLRLRQMLSDGWQANLRAADPRPMSARVAEELERLVQPEVLAGPHGAAVRQAVEDRAEVRALGVARELVGVVGRPREQDRRTLRHLRDQDHRVQLHPIAQLECSIGNLDPWMLFRGSLLG